MKGVDKILAVQYKGNSVTLENYESVFVKKDRDVLDEIRLAIMDETPIGSYIDRCGTDWYKLSQIRRSLRMGVPKKYISTGLSGDCIGKFRELYIEGYKTESFDKYLSSVKGVGSISLIKDEKLYKLLDAYKLFSNVVNIDFRQVNSEAFETILQGIKCGYPVWILTESDEKMSVEMLKTLMKVMALEIDVFYFLGRGYSVEQIALICSSVQKNDLDYFMGKINAKFTLDMLSVLVTVSKYRETVDLLTIKDEEEEPVYNYYQMYELARCVLNGIDVKPISNPEISDFDMQGYYEEQMKKQKKAKSSKAGTKQLGGRLAKTL